jgi:hypothetical protein
MNKNTAAGLWAACAQVLRVPDDPGRADVASMDVEDLLTRFQNPRKQWFKRQVLEAYEHRFRNAVKSYKDYLENPGAWKPGNHDPSSGPERRPRASNAAAAGGTRHPRRAARIQIKRFV